MKSLFFIIFFLIFSILQIEHVLAQAPNDSNVAESIEIKVDQIKDKVASRVAELNLVEKRGIVGVVENVSGNEIRIIDLNEKTRIIDVDELTKYSSENGSFDLADIEKGSKISAIGLYNKDSEKLLARFVNETSIPLFLNGVIADKDEKNFNITLLTEGERKYTIDIESVTKSFSFNDDDLVTSTFSRLPLLKNALIIGYPNPKEEGRITAGRIIIFPDVPKNPRIEIDETTLTPTKSASLSPTPSDEE